MPFQFAIVDNLPTVHTVPVRFLKNKALKNEYGNIVKISWGYFFRDRGLGALLEVIGKDSDGLLEPMTAQHPDNQDQVLYLKLPLFI